MLMWENSEDGSPGSLFMPFLVKKTVVLATRVEPSGEIKATVQSHKALNSIDSYFLICKLVFSALEQIIRCAVSFNLAA